MTYLFTVAPNSSSWPWYTAGHALPSEVSKYW